MKKFVAFATVGTLGFFVGAYWACFKICQMVDAGVDVNGMAKDCMNRAEKNAEVRINKWHRKYSEICHK
ncbi:MAG: hypothetical protein J6N70_14670 [Oribacterium sp.]|nr:hypothetical protein [Oribacterium sp.]